MLSKCCPILTTDKTDETMITFRPFVGSPRKDGSRVVYVSVTLHRKSRRIPTTLTATARDLTRSGHIKAPSLVMRFEELVREFRAAVSTLSPFAVETMSVDDVVEVLRRGVGGSSFRLDFLAYARAYILKNKAPGTRKNYSAAVEALATYCAQERGSDTLDINDINKALLLSFREWAVARGCYASTYKHGGVPRRTSEAQAVRYLAKLSHIFAAAKERFNDEDAGLIVIPRSPFSSFRLSAPLSGEQVQGNLGVEVMQRVISAKTNDEDIRLALDAFVVSFTLMGANLADLYEAKVPRGEWWEYERRKTRTRREDKAFLSVKVDERARPYLARLSKHARGGVWFPRLRAAAPPESITGKINRGLRRWCKSEGLPPFTFYAARKTWASLARNKAGVDKATIDECLCHRGDLRLADIYIERDWEVLARANARVLNLLRWDDGVAEVAEVEHNDKV